MHSLERFHKAGVEASFLSRNLELVALSGDLPDIVFVVESRGVFGHVALRTRVDATAGQDVLWFACGIHRRKSVK